MPSIFMNTAVVAALFVGTVLCLTLDRKKKNILIAVSAAAAVVIGVPLYVYGFTRLGVSAGDVVFRALLAVCKMFAGDNDLSSLSQVPLFSDPWVLTLFWLGHFLAFFVTAGATISVLGSRLLNVIRTTRLRRGPLLLVYGSGPDAVTYAARQIRQYRKTVLFVDDDCSSAGEANISAIGALLDRAEDAVLPDARFLRRLSVRPGSRSLELALLRDQPLKNLEYARNMLAALRAAGIQPAQTALILRGIDELDARELMAGQAHYGYGSLYAYCEHAVVARMLIRLCPPCNVIPFDGQGRATADFRALIVGFGSTGKAVLEQLIMNAQFAGSRFSADIFDPAPRCGTLYHSEIMTRYNIRFHDHDAFSQAFYAFLEENSVSYIVLTGDENDNLTVCADLRKWYRKRGDCPRIFLCSRHGVTESFGADFDDRYSNIYASDALNVRKMDSTAMEINRYYCKNGLSAEENWQTCDYFSRLSCRAAADFYPAVLRALGTTEEQVLHGDWHIPAPVLENLAESEHLRWCAFHYVMGYHPMDRAVFNARAAQYLDEKKQTGSSSVRIGKDPENCLHACLIPWDELDALSAAENAVTGGNVDYKQMDRDNVFAVPQIIRRSRARQ